eukprot:SAG25_NODE_30_length_20554_cov_36.028694_22_plen_197_part_00
MELRHNKAHSTSKFTMAYLQWRWPKSAYFCAGIAAVWQAHITPTSTLQSVQGRSCHSLKCTVANPLVSSRAPGAGHPCSHRAACKYSASHLKPLGSSLLAYFGSVETGAENRDLPLATPAKRSSKVRALDLSAHTRHNPSILPSDGSSDSGNAPSNGVLAGATVDAIVACTTRNMSVGRITRRDNQCAATHSFALR